MEPKVYFPDELIKAVSDYKKKMKADKDILNPIRVNDLVIWNDDGIDRKSFKKSMDLYFEYELIGHDSSLYLITGLKEIVI